MKNIIQKIEQSMIGEAKAVQTVACTNLHLSTNFKFGGLSDYRDLTRGLEALSDFL